MARIIFSSAFLVVVAACGGSSGGPPTTLGPASAVDALAKAGPVLQDLESVRFRIEVDGDPVFIDGAELLAASSAEGQYQAPASFQAVVQVKVFGITAEVGAINIGEDQWITNPITSEWERLPPDFGFDPLTLFDPDIGLGAMLAGGVEGAEFSGPSEGVDSYAITGTLQGSQVEVITAGLVAEPEVEILVAIDATTSHVEQVTFDTGGGTSQWTVSFSDFDEPVTIEPPETE
ncbi:MAG: LppX_LprAFG lipoprotein [Acidimicrobiia bacterium]|nr:LppX_LprAFG lipoprotein [Acidimicrobiia bacterium]